LNAESLFRHHATTFFQAARFFAPKDRTAITYLYAFCRTVDDLADQDSEAGEGLIKLAALVVQIERRELSDFPELYAIVQEKQIAWEHLHFLLTSIVGDLQARHIASWRELISYCMGVASTVGLIVCKIVGVNDPRALPHAIDLGIAMQLSNITYLWVYGLASTVFFLHVLVLIYKVITSSYSYLDGSAKSYMAAIWWLFLISWCLYPIAYIMPVIANTAWGVVARQGIYTVADIASKVVYGVFLTQVATLRTEKMGQS
jgi:hypothetical protein